MSTPMLMLMLMPMPMPMEMTMPEGGVMSPWSGAAVSFLGMWVVMMMAMMLPSLIPTLWRYRQAMVGTGETRSARLTALMGAGYFFVWTMTGIAVYLLDAALTYFQMQLPALTQTIPVAAGMIVLLGGAMQFTSWKARHLACCRETIACCRTLPTGSGLRTRSAAAWRQGLRLGLHCTCCCAGPTAILLVIGMMNLIVMTVVTAAITIERLAPDGERVAQASGAIAVATGLILTSRAAGLT